MTQFDEQLMFGQIGENWIEHQARKAGFLVERNCSEAIINGKGPRAHSNEVDSIPRPDLVLSKRGCHFPVEVKTKNSRTVGLITGNEETGIDHQKWIDYRDYERATGSRILLVNVEFIDLAQWLTAYPRARAEFERTGSTSWFYRPDACLSQWLANLRTSLNKPTECRGQAMVYFSIDQFESGWLEMLEDAVNDNGRTLL
jgi:hypothetical protein